MNMIVLGIVAAIGLAVIAGVALQYSNPSSGQHFQTDSVRQ